VTVTGAEDNVYECKDHLLNLAEEYIQDVQDNEYMQAPSRQHNAPPAPHGNPHGYVVKGAPWDMNSQNDFPDLGGGNAGSKGAVSWGPGFRR